MGPLADNPQVNQSARAGAFSRADAAITAIAQQPDQTLILRPNSPSPGELADEAAAVAGSHHADYNARQSFAH